VSATARGLVDAAVLVDMALLAAGRGGRDLGGVRRGDGDELLGPQDLVDGVAGRGPLGAEVGLGVR